MPLASTDNPAGRLHAILTRLVNEHRDDQSLDQAWARTLGCAEGDFRSLGAHLSEAAALLNNCRITAESLKSIADIDNLLYHFPAWSRAIFGFGMGRSSGINRNVILGPDQLASLGTLSLVLHLHAPELVFRTDAEEQQLDECRSQLLDLVSSVENEPLLPEQVRSNILRALGDVIESFHFLQYRGAEHLARSANSAMQLITPSDESRGLATEPVLERLDRLAEKAKRIFESIWSMLAPPTGAIYILATGDVIGGGAIMAVNPRVAQSVATIASAIRTGVGQRQIESPPPATE
jgi:hypothetical protein